MGRCKQAKVEAMSRDADVFNEFADEELLEKPTAGVCHRSVPVSAR